MKVTITAKKLTINQSFTDYATQKLSAKLDRFFPEEAEAKITLEERRELIILELTVNITVSSTVQSSPRRTRTTPST